MRQGATLVEAEGVLKPKASSFPLRPSTFPDFSRHFPHHPLAVVGVPTLPDRSPHPLKILKHFTIDDILFDDHDKGFRYAIGLGLFNEGDAGSTARRGEIIDAKFVLYYSGDGGRQVLSTLSCLCPNYGHSSHKRDDIRTKTRTEVDDRGRIFPHRWRRPQETAPNPGSRD
jgi:hypothetical protein